jgi:hypothetical protein
MKVSEGWKGAWSDYGDKCEGRTHRPTDKTIPKKTLSEAYGKYGTFSLDYVANVHYLGAHKYKVTTTPSNPKFAPTAEIGDGFNNVLFFGGEELRANPVVNPLLSNIACFKSTYCDSTEGKDNSRILVKTFISDEAKNTTALWFRDDGAPKPWAFTEMKTSTITHGYIAHPTTGVMGWRELMWGSGGDMNIPVFNRGTIRYIGHPDYDASSNWVKMGQDFPK